MLRGARNRERLAGIPASWRIVPIEWLAVVAAQLKRLDAAGEIDMHAKRQANGLSPTLSRLDNSEPSYIEAGFIVEAMRLNTLRRGGPLTPEVRAEVNQASNQFFGHRARHFPLKRPRTREAP